MAGISSGVCHTYHTSSAEGDFALRLSDFVTSSTVHFRSSLQHLPALCSKAFSLTVHHLSLTTSAAQGGLTTLPDTALSVDLPPSFKELHGTSGETQSARCQHSAIFYGLTLESPRLFAFCDNGGPSKFSSDMNLWKCPCKQIN
jgi:hypothetical protein